VAQGRHSPHRAILIEVMFSLGASGNKVGMEISDEFLNLCQMIVVLAPILVFPRLEKQVTCEHFVHHAAKGPDIGCFVIA